MPPSGYSTAQSQLIAGFLGSCADALVQEASQRRLSIPEALRKEVADIEQALGSGWRDDLSRPVLELTLAFYRELLRRSNNEETFSAILPETLRAFAHAVNDVHL